MWLCEDTLKGKTAHFRLLSSYQNRVCLSSHLFEKKEEGHSNNIIIHQSRYEKSDWSRAFNQFTIACELDMINAVSSADIAFIMSSSTSAWLLSPLEFSSETKWLNASLLFLRMNYVKNV